MKRRKFIVGLGGAAAWPLMARAQQAAMPVIGFLGTRATGDDPQLLEAFRRGLKEAGYVRRDRISLRGESMRPTESTGSRSRSASGGRDCREWPCGTGAKAAARTLGLQVHVLHASSDRDFDTVFARLVELRLGGLVIGGEPFFNSRIGQLAALTIRYAVPAIYQLHAFAAGGGLVSYGGSLTDSYRLVGVYTGQILRGAKPADLPVRRATKVEMIIDLKTAKMFGLTVPQSLLGRADEVIE